MSENSWVGWAILIAIVIVVWVVDSDVDSYWD